MPTRAKAASRPRRVGKSVDDFALPAASLDADEQVGQVEAHQRGEHARQIEAADARAGAAEPVEGQQQHRQADHHRQPHEREDARRMERGVARGDELLAKRLVLGVDQGEARFLNRIDERQPRAFGLLRAQRPADNCRDLAAADQGDGEIGCGCNQSEQARKQQQPDDRLFGKDGHHWSYTFRSIRRRMV